MKNKEKLSKNWPKAGLVRKENSDNSSYESFSFNLVLSFFPSEMAGLLMACLSTSPSHFTTRLYWSDGTL